MDNQEHERVTVFTAYDEMDAEVVKLALEAAGIPCFIENAHQAALAGVLPALVQVLVSDEQRAKQVLSDHAPSTEEP